jgi:formate-dependent nitrite reductase membrane component NrfD
MQACPYDALYIDPDSNTAAKCNFCAHRVELNLEPACVVVCPTRAIIAGDLDDGESQVAGIVATQKVAVRKPHKGTRPKLFYAGIDGDLLQPTMIEPQPSHLWAERRDEGGIAGAESAGNGPSPSGARAVYDVSHAQPWGTIPALYLWTKSIAAGLIIVAALLSAIGLGAAKSRPVLDIMSPLAALVFVAATVALLIADLKRPERFYYILTKSNPRSWLVWGTYVLIVFSAFTAGWLGFGLFAGSVPGIVVALAAVAGIGSACYSAFLFAQAKGRDLWQSPLFLWHLLIQAIVAGASVVAILAVVNGAEIEMVRAVDWILLAAVAVNALIILGEVCVTPFSDDVRRAVELMTRGSLARSFWYGAIMVGALIPAILLWFALAQNVAGNGLEIVAAVGALTGLFFFEEIWIRAGQSPPLS